MSRRPRTCRLSSAKRLATMRPRKVRPPPPRRRRTGWSGGRHCRGASDRAAARPPLAAAHHGPWRRWPQGRLRRLGCGSTERRFAATCCRRSRRHFVLLGGFGHTRHRRLRVRRDLHVFGRVFRRRHLLGAGPLVNRRHRRGDIRLAGFVSRSHISWCRRCECDKHGIARHRVPRQYRDGSRVRFSNCGNCPGKWQHRRQAENTCNRSIDRLDKSLHGKYHQEPKKQSHRTTQRDRRWDYL
jgi:hypothetical protein